MEIKIQAIKFDATDKLQAFVDMDDRPALSASGVGDWVLGRAVPGGVAQ